MTYVDPANIAGRLMYLKTGTSITKAELLDAIDYIHKRSIDYNADVLVGMSSVDTSIRCCYDMFDYNETNGMICLVNTKTKQDLKRWFDARLPIDILAFLSNSISNFVVGGLTQ